MRWPWTKKPRVELVIGRRQRIEWTKADGAQYKMFLLGDTGTKFMSILEDFVINSAFNPRLSNDYRQAMCDFYSRIVTMQASDQEAAVLAEQSADVTTMQDLPDRTGVKPEDT